METSFESAYSAAAGDIDKLKTVAKQFPAKWCELSQKLAVDDGGPAALAHLNIALGLTTNKIVRAGILNDIGRVHANLGYTSASLGYFHKALENNRTHPGIMANLGLAYRWNSDLKSARKWLDASLKQNPWEPSAALESAFVTMLGGDYLKGFDLYECRFRTPGGTLKRMICDKPEWNLTNGKRLLVYGEQGAGDILLMLRYAKPIRAAGVHQTWVVNESMLPLLQTIPEIDCVLKSGVDVPDFDCHIPAASLPRLFKTTIDTIPSPLVFPFSKPKQPNQSLDVGIVWRGNKTQANDHIRSTSLKEWLPVLNLDGINFHSLQVDGADEALLYPQIKTYEPPTDWLDTARRIQNLDLVIGVDTSIVHLAGCLGVPCWCALHCRPYFVFPLTRQDCPWYPSVRLFKQQNAFEWGPVFESIAKDLCSINTPK